MVGLLVASLRLGPSVWPETLTNIHTQMESHQRGDFLETGSKLSAVSLLPLISHHLRARRRDRKCPAYLFHSTTSLPQVDYKYIFFPPNSKRS